MKTRRTIRWAMAAVVLLAVAGVVAAMERGKPATIGDDIPTARVKRGDLDLKVFATGELRATHIQALTAPPIGGGALQITHLLGTGTAVKKGDLVIDFDPSEQHYKLDQSRSELLQRLTSGPGAPSGELLRAFAALSRTTGSPAESLAASTLEALSSAGRDLPNLEPPRMTTGNVRFVEP